MPTDKAAPDVSLTRRPATSGRRTGPLARLGRFAQVLCVLLLAGCAATGPAPVRDAEAPRAAEAAYASGRFGEAAEIWQREAVDLEPGAAARLRVRAADAWLRAGRPARAEALIEWIDREPLAAPDRARLDLVLAALALRKGRPLEARSLLDQARGSLPSSALPRYRELERRTESELARPAAISLESITRRVAALRYYNPEEAVDLLRALEEVPSGELALRAANPRAERQLTGWLDLALAVRRNLVVPDRVAEAMAAWKGRHPYHLLSRRQALDAWLRYRQTFSRPRKVAVLIPGSGRLEPAGNALRDGLLSAYLEDPGGAELLFFPTGDESQSAISAYFNARDAGADLIVGPLRKESVAAMLELAGMVSPVLALNDFPAGFEAPPELTGQVFGISLSQERETAVIARHLNAMEFRRAAVLAPENGWGERMVAAFQAEFLRHGGTIVAAGRYLEEENDHSAVLRRLLKIDESETRRRQLENTLQMPLEFEPIRRDDIDAIFLAAMPMQARLLRPQLKFHDAGDIPVYATGRVYSGRPEPERNQDLDGLRFPTTPWQLAHRTAAEIPDLDSLQGGSLAYLYALGQDAWNLLPWLGLMSKDPDFEFPGQSGAYAASNPVNLERRPAWAEFRDGVPVPLKPVLPLSAASALH